MTFSLVCCNAARIAIKLAYRVVAKDMDWVFASKRMKGKTPRVGNMLVRDYLYPAAVAVGVLTEKTIVGKKRDKKTGRLKLRRVSTLIAREKR